jgi:hypothetical protein
VGQRQGCEASTPRPEEPKYWWRPTLYLLLKIQKIRVRRILKKMLMRIEVPQGK